MKIKKKKLIKYLKKWAKASEKNAKGYSDVSDYTMAYEAILIADFIKENLIEGIEYEFIDDLNEH